MTKQDDMPDLQTQVEGGTGYPRETPADAYASGTLRSEAFEAAWGRAVRDIYTSDVDIVKAMYDACVIGWRAGFEYGQQS